MTRDIALTLAVTGGALGLFVWNRLRVDVVGVIVMTALILLGLVTPRQGISGFANEATITVALMLVLSAGLLRTGAISLLGRAIARLAGESELRLLLVILATVVPVSAFINNTAAVAILLPMLMGLTRDAGIPPSRLLMPLSFGGQLGGTLTLIGTSTNLLVAGLVLDLGVGRIRLFDITPPALVLAGAGVLYLATVGRWLTPRREVAEDLLSGYGLRDYVTQIEIPAGSALEGRSLGEASFREAHGLEIIQMERSGTRMYPFQTTVLRAGDRLLVRGTTPDVAQAASEEHMKIVGSPESLDLEGAEDRLAEIIVAPGSRAVGRTLVDLRFRQRFGIVVLGLQRHGSPPEGHIAEIPLAAGDVMLVSGAEDRLQRLHHSGDFAVLGAVDLPAQRTGKIPLAVAVLAGVVLLPAFHVTTILVSALLGAIAMILTGCIRPDEVYEEVDWMVIVLLGSILALGVAMQQTGTAEFLARGIVDAIRPLGIHGIVGALYLIATLLTSIISNNAAAVVLTPLAVETARGLEISPMPLIIAIMLAASNSFITPIGYQTNTFIYGPGGYRFIDFLRVGGPLTLLLLVLASWVIPLFFPA